MRPASSALEVAAFLQAEASTSSRADRLRTNSNGAEFFTGSNWLKGVPGTTAGALFNGGPTGAVTITFGNDVLRRRAERRPTPATSISLIRWM